MPGANPSRIVCRASHGIWPNNVFAAENRHFRNNTKAKTPQLSKASGGKFRRHVPQSRSGPLRWEAVTATRESQRAARERGNGPPQWWERSAMPSLRGVPLWGALLLAVIPTALGTVLDILLWSRPSLLFQASFFVGCVLAVTLVKRRAVFGPMVQPPLILALVMPLVVLVIGSGSPEGSGLTGQVLSVLQPLISGFPIMTATAIATLGIGLIRTFVTQRKATGNKSRRKARDTDDVDSTTTRKERKTDAGARADRKKPGPNRPPPENEPRRTSAGQSPNPPAGERQPRRPGRGRPGDEPPRDRQQPPRNDEPNPPPRNTNRPRGSEPPQEARPAPPRGAPGRPAPGARPAPPSRPRPPEPPPPPGHGPPTRQPRPPREGPPSHA